MKSLDKATEIKLLRQLAENESYFSQTFNRADVDVMIHNIQQDFPILLGTSINKSAEELESVRNEAWQMKRKYELAQEMITGMKELEQAADEQMKRVAQAAVQAYSRGEIFDIGMYIGDKEVIKIKLANGIDLTGDQRMFLLSLI